MGNQCLLMVTYYHEVFQVYHLARLIWKVVPGDPLMSCTPLPKAAKPVWAKQLTRLPCLVVNVKFQFVYTTSSKIGSQLLLASTSSNVLLERGSEKTFNECLGVSNVFPSAA